MKKLLNKMSREELLACIKRSIRADKIGGAIVRHAMGDCLGAPVEFYPFSHYTGILETPIVRFTARCKTFV